MRQPSPKPQRKTKGHVASACVPCKRAHLRFVYTRSPQKTSRIRSADHLADAMVRTPNELSFCPISSQYIHK